MMLAVFRPLVEPLKKAAPTITDCRRCFFPLQFFGLVSLLALIGRAPYILQIAGSLVNAVHQEDRFQPFDCLVIF
jgi:hypothetical protein